MKESNILVSSVDPWSNKVGSDTLSALAASHPPNHIASLNIRAQRSDSEVAGRYFHIIEGRVMKSIFHPSIHPSIATGEPYLITDRAELDFVKNIPAIRVISNFLNKSDYDDIMHKSAALVINTYRQMAMGNIFYALRNGIKVYMNNKNIMYGWLLEEGFVVFSINDLLYDINNHNITLSVNQTQLNKRAYKKLMDKYSVDKFHQNLLSLSRQR